MNNFALFRKTLREELRERTPAKYKITGNDPIHIRWSGAFPDDVHIIQRIVFAAMSQTDGRVTEAWMIRDQETLGVIIFGDLIELSYLGVRPPITWARTTPEALERELARYLRHMDLFSWSGYWEIVATYTERHGTERYGVAELAERYRANAEAIKAGKLPCPKCRVCKSLEEFVPLEAGRRACLCITCHAKD